MKKTFYYIALCATLFASVSGTFGQTAISPSASGGNPENAVQASESKLSELHENDNYKNTYKDSIIKTINPEEKLNSGQPFPSKTENILNLTYGILAPAISVSTSSLSGVFYQYMDSPPLVYLVSANNLTANLTIQAVTNIAPDNFEGGIKISLSPNSDYSTEISISPVNGSISYTIIYVKIPSGFWDVGQYIGTIINSSPGAQSIAIPTALECAYPPTRTAPIVTLGNVNAFPETIVNVPLTVVDYEFVSFLDYTVEFNPQVLTFRYHENLNNNILWDCDEVIMDSISPVLCRLFIHIGCSPDYWYSIPDGETLMDLVFTYHSGSTALNFVNGSYSYAWGGNVAYIDEPFENYYHNGSVGMFPKILALTINLEGLFNPAAGGMNQAQGNGFQGEVADEISVGIAQSLFPYTIVFEQASVLLNQNGTSQIGIPEIYNGEYYIVVRHRNSIETWSANPVSFTGSSITYNFSAVVNAAYGNNLKLSGTKYCLFVGDVNQDGVVDTGDMTPLDNDAAVFTEGYVATDANGDGIVDTGDMTFLDNNASNFVEAVFPHEVTSPVVSTIIVSEITNTTGLSSSEVINSGGATVTQRGVCWGTGSNPTISGAHTIDGNGTGTFTSSVTGLTPNTLYYLRAYATNSAGTAYGNTINFFSGNCGAPFTLTHLAGSVSPVNKTITYNTVETNLSGAVKCWITQNLGADHPAISATDASEASAGWYWQFNRPQGFKHDGTTRTPNTAWITSIEEYCNWQPSNDPCALLLGNTWRIPTFNEWSSSRINGDWEIAADCYNSALKLHMAGYIYPGGDLGTRGDEAFYWSTTQNQYSWNGEEGWALIFNSGGDVTWMWEREKSFGSPLRCLNEPSSALMTPSVLTNPLNNVTPTTVTASGEVLFSGSSSVITRGVCWSTQPGPTLADFFTSAGNGQGNFTSNISGLSPSTVYYLRAYATNNGGTAFGNEVSFITTSASPCTSFTISHSAGTIAPVSKMVTYGTIVTNLTGTNKCWITQNLGADHQATSALDATEASAGWYWQFNQKQGFKHDGSTRTPNTLWISNINENSDWTYTNDPCILLLGGWRIPTRSEWQSASINDGWEDVEDTYASVLKIHAAGNLESEGENMGNIENRGNAGQIWSSNQTSPGGGWFLDTDINIYEAVKSTGKSIRCLRD